jgi:hypothetical protein
MIVVRLLVGALLATVVLMGFGFAYWTQLPGRCRVLHEAPDHDRLASVLQAELPASGVYMLPWSPAHHENPADPEIQKTYLDRHEAGPLAMIYLSKEGFDPASQEAMIRVYGSGAGHFFVSALLAGALLASSGCGRCGYFGRVGFVFGLGLFAAVAVRISDPIWFAHPWDFSLFQVAYAVIGWLLAGIFLAAVVKTKAPAP